MKKIILLIAVLALISFTNSPAPPVYGVSVDSEIVQADGMTYRVFTGKATHDNYIDIEVVNVTKEKLEIEKLKLDIKKLKSN
jgi:hypothetical protein